MWNDILLFAEQRNGHLSKISREIAGGAWRLAKQQGGHVYAFFPGYHLEENALLLLSSGADQVLLADHPSFAEYSTLQYCKSFLSAVNLVNPGLILCGSTCIGMDLAAAAAASLDAGLAADCTGLWIDMEELQRMSKEEPSRLHVSSQYRMERPNADGIHTDLLYSQNSTILFVTLRPGVLMPLSKEEAVILPPKSTDSIHNLPLPERSSENEIQLLHAENNIQSSTDITEARILVSGGRGIGNSDNFQKLTQLADLLGGSVACSRACVEAGWANPSCQVGQTGKTVRPDLYLAFGISGAFQHITGMDESKLIIAVNKNPAAPIFDIADLGIVGNTEVILPQLIKALKEYQT